MTEYAFIFWNKGQVYFVPSQDPLLSSSRVLCIRKTKIVSYVYNEKIALLIPRIDQIYINIYIVVYAILGIACYHNWNWNATLIAVYPKYITYKAGIVVHT